MVDITENIFRKKYRNKINNRFILTRIVKIVHMFAKLFEINYMFKKKKSN